MGQDQDDAKSHQQRSQNTKHRKQFVARIGVLRLIIVPNP